MTNRDQVRAFVADLLRRQGSRDGTVADDESLVMSGRLDSLDVVEILTFLESEFGFSLDPSEFDQMNFDSIDSILLMLERAPRAG